VLVLACADIRFFEAESANDGAATGTSAIRQIGRPVLAFFHGIEVILERI
jgi:hypothetical protein